MKNGIILVNPAELADKPKREKFEPVSYTREEVLKLWQEVQGTIMELPVYFALFFGLRRSEAVGVKWSAIDFDNHVINVNNKITLVHSEGAVHITESSTMKSESSKSCYPLNEEQCRYLKSVQEKQREYIRITQDYTDYVCVNEIGELITPDYVTHKFSKLLKSLGLKHIRFHDLRHCCISLASYGKSMVNFSDFHYNDLSYSLTYGDLIKDFYILQQKSGREFRAYINQERENIARTVQDFIEHAVVSIVSSYVEKYNFKNICLAGGLFLNCLTNHKILEKCNVENAFFIPSSGDDGQALGSAYYAYIHEFGYQEPFKVVLPYLGVSYSDIEIKNALEEKN